MRFAVLVRREEWLTADEIRAVISDLVPTGDRTWIEGGLGDEPDASWCPVCIGATWEKLLIIPARSNYYGYEAAMRVREPGTLYFLHTDLFCLTPSELASAHRLLREVVRRFHARFGVVSVTRLSSGDGAENAPWEPSEPSASFEEWLAVVSSWNLDTGACLARELRSDAQQPDEIYGPDDSEDLPTKDCHVGIRLSGHATDDWYGVHVEAGRSEDAVEVGREVLRRCPTLRCAWVHCSGRTSEIVQRLEHDGRMTVTTAGSAFARTVPSSLVLEPDAETGWTLLRSDGFSAPELLFVLSKRLEQRRFAFGLFPSDHETEPGYFKTILAHGDGIRIIETNPLAGTTIIRVGDRSVEFENSPLHESLAREHGVETLPVGDRVVLADSDTMRRLSECVPGWGDFDWIDVAAGTSPDDVTAIGPEPFLDWKRRTALLELEPRLIVHLHDNEWLTMLCQDPTDASEVAGYQIRRDFCRSLPERFATPIAGFPEDVRSGIAEMAWRDPIVCGTPQRKGGEWFSLIRRSIGVQSGDPGREPLARLTLNRDTARWTLEPLPPDDRDPGPVGPDL